jgi:hypothetical protein
MLRQFVCAACIQYVQSQTPHELPAAMPGATDMSVLNRIINHIFYNAFGAQSEGARIARNAFKNVGVDHPLAEVGATGAGAFVGSVIGGMRMLSPLAIIKTVVESDEGLEKRIEEMGPWGGIE